MRVTKKGWIKLAKIIIGWVIAMLVLSIVLLGCSLGIDTEILSWLSDKLAH